MVTNFINIFESGLSRIWQASQQHDIAILTAWRSKLVDCLDDAQCTGQVLSRAEKDRRNFTLKSALLSLGYGVTAVDGSFIEGYGEPHAKEVAENSFFVVNLKGDPSFASNIEKLGQHYCQDAVFIKPQGQEPFLLGTNKLGPGQKTVFSKSFTAGKIPGPFFSKVNNRPFAWESFDALQNAGKAMVLREGDEILKKAGIK